MAGKQRHFFIGVAVGQARLMRMDADRSPYPIVLLGIRNSTIDLGRGVAIADGKHRGQSGLPCPGKHLRPVAIELTALYVGMRVYVQSMPS